MRFGFLLFPRNLHAVGEIARLGEDLGFDLVGLPDSPALAYDPYIALTLAARESGRIRLGPAVTNLQTRHPLILANLAATLERLAPGRTFLGLGTGNSGVRHAGAGPGTLADLEGSAAMIRRLLAGEAVERDGAAQELRLGGSPVPIMMAASGPRGLRLAGRVADLAFFNLGVTPDVVGDGLGWVAEGAAAAGRDPAAVEPWLYAVTSIAEDRAEALDAARGAAIAVAAYVLRGDAAAKRIPPEVERKVGQLLREYDYGEHFTPGRSRNYYLAERLGLADYLLGRFALAGTPEDCRQQLERLGKLGVRNVCLNLAAAADLPGSLRLLGERVLPGLIG